MARAYLILRHPSFISGVFTLFNWRKFLLFIILLIDEWLILVCSAILWGARYVCGASSCEQISSSIKSVFSSVVTDLDWPEPWCYCLSNAPKVFLGMCKSSSLMNGLSKFYTQTNLFLHNHFEWWFCLLLKTPLWTNSDEKILWAKSQTVNNT